MSLAVLFHVGSVLFGIVFWNHNSLIKTNPNVFVKMAAITIFLHYFLLQVVLISFSKATLKSVTVFVGSSVEINCESSLYPPIWSWKGVKQSQPRTLAFAGTQPHPDLNDPRFTFSQNGSSFKLRLNGVKTTDAGTFNCQGGSLQQTLINVLR